MAIAVVGLCPTEARACSCFGESKLVAPAGAEHPVGAPLVFHSFCGGTLDAWSVTVDGQPATLAVPGTFVDGIDTVAIEPAPPLGASVVASLACSASFEVGGCDDPEATIDTPFVIGPADTTAPAPPREVVLLQQDGDFNIGCDEDTLDLRLDAIVELDAIEPGVWVEVELSRNGEVIGQRALLASPEGEVTSVHYLERDEVEGTEVCATAVVRDASGNVSAAARSCEGFAGTSRGCACATAREGAPGRVGLVALVVAGVLGRRRARRR